MPVASWLLIWGAAGASATPPLIRVDLLKHGCLVKKCQISFKIKVGVREFFNVIPKTLIVFGLHLPILQATLLGSHLVWMTATG